MPVPSAETEPATAPLPSQYATQPATGAELPTVGTPPSSGGKKKWLIGGIVAGAFVLLTGGGAAAYFLWYQNPDKVVADAIGNLLTPASYKSTAKLAYSSKSGGVTLTVDTISAQTRAKGTAVLEGQLNDGADTRKLKLEADFAGETDAEKQKAFFRLKNVRQNVQAVIDTVIDQQAESYAEFGQRLSPQQLKQAKEQMMAQFAPIIEKFDNRWIVFNSERDADDPYVKQQKCTSDVLRKLGEGGAMRDELFNTYGKHRFIVIKEQLGSKDGSVGYVLDLDMEKAEAFRKAVKQTAFTKAMDKCARDNGIEPDAGEPLKKEDNPFRYIRMELWIDQWSHRVTGVNVSLTKIPDMFEDDTKVSLNVAVDYVKVSDEEIKLPKGATDIETVFQEVEEALLGSDGSSASGPVFGALSGGSVQSQASTNKANALQVDLAVSTYMSNNRGNLPATVDQLLPTVAYMDTTLAAKLTNVEPTAQTADEIYYRYCGGRQYEIKYFDSNEGRAVALDEGSCTGGSAGNGAGSGSGNGTGTSA